MNGDGLSPVVFVLAIVVRMYVEGNIKSKGVFKEQRRWVGVNLLSR